MSCLSGKLQAEKLKIIVSFAKAFNGTYSSLQKAQYKGILLLTTLNYEQHM